MIVVSTHRRPNAVTDTSVNRLRVAPLPLVTLTRRRNQAVDTIGTAELFVSREVV
jgi:hypothetical protein